MNNLLLTEDGATFVLTPKSDKFSYEEMCEYLNNPIGLEYVYYEVEGKVAVVADNDEDILVYKHLPPVNILASEVTGIQLHGRVLLLNEFDLEEYNC